MKLCTYYTVEEEMKKKEADKLCKQIKVKVHSFYEEGEKKTFHRVFHSVRALKSVDRSISRSAEPSIRG